MGGNEWWKGEDNRGTERKGEVGYGDRGIHFWALGGWGSEHEILELLEHGMDSQVCR